jgi:hypothetical protein
MKKIFILVFSTGWILTLLSSMYLNVAFIKNEVYPILYESKEQLNSFPYMQAVETLLGITLVWFILVLISWSIYFIRTNRL